MAYPTNDEVLSVLTEVVDPEERKGIVELGYIDDIEVDSGILFLVIRLKKPVTPLRKGIGDDCRSVLEKAFPDLSEVRVSVTGPQPKAAGKTGPDRNVDPEKTQKALPGVKNIIAVASGKGGVGKSTVAVNLAAALALEGARVGLLDADVYGPSIPTMMGVHEQPAFVDGKLVPVQAHGVHLMSIGFVVDDEDAMIWRGPMASGAVSQFLSDVSWGELDVLILDLPPGTGDIQLTIVQKLPLTGAVVVTTPQDVALADVRRANVMFSKVNVPVLGIVENMSYFICPGCGRREEIFSHGGGQAAADKLGVPFLGELPLLTGIRASGDAGTPVVVSDPNSEQAQAFLRIARSLRQ